MAGKSPADQGPVKRTLSDLFREYVRVKRIHYSKSRKTFYSARVEKILAHCKFEYPADIRGSAVLEYIAQRQEKRSHCFSATTAEHYRRDFGFFCNWLIEQKELDKKPFGKRDKFRGGDVHRRRALDRDEQHRLLASAERSKEEVDSIPGKTRKLIYWTALRTGYRSNELRCLTVGSLRGDRLTLDGKFCKNSEDANQPLPSALAVALRAFVKRRPKGEPLFPWWDLGVKLVKVDGRAAGIPYETEDGYADFHSLRHTFCTDLFSAGVDAKTAHILMRHKSIAQTMVYAKTDDSKKRDAIARLEDGSAVSVPECFNHKPTPVDPGLLLRVYGTDDMEALQLRGDIDIDHSGAVRVARGDFRGLILGHTGD